MVQLKQVSIRLKSIKNIQKITKTMKMVSASKYVKYAMVFIWSFSKQLKIQQLGVMFIFSVFLFIL